MSAEITEKLTAAALRRGQALERSLQIFPQIVIRGVDACGPGRTDMQYSEVVVAHFNQPRHAGRMENPDALGLAGTPGAGPFMALYLRCSGGSVADAAYQTFGCAPAVAAGSVLTDWLIGRPLEDCHAMDESALERLLGGLPEHKRFCAAIAVAALRAALSRVNRPPG